MKIVFRLIHTNSANLFHGRPPLSEIHSDLILARSMPSGPSTPEVAVPRQMFAEILSLIAQLRALPAPA
jgi:hypothetical protein